MTNPLNNSIFELPRENNEIAYRETNIHDGGLSELNRIHAEFVKLCEEFKGIFTRLPDASQTVNSESITEKSTWLLNRFNDTIMIGKNIRTEESFIRYGESLNKSFEKCRTLEQTTSNMIKKDTLKGHEPTIKKNLQDFVEIHNGIEAEINRFIKFFQAETNRFKDFEKEQENGDNWIKEIETEIERIDNKMSILIAKSIDVTEYAKSLQHIKDKLKIEKDKSEELGKVDIIHAWPIPTLYKFFVFVGLGLFTSGTAMIIGGIGDLYGMLFPFAGLVILSIGSYFWNKHDKAKLIAYDAETSLNAKLLLDDIGIKAWYKEWSLDRKNKKEEKENKRKKSK